ncbi:VOC family protein [Microbacterium terrisoli]|jgi:predicted enzyme related to lactoylglutathione lyase|uniref:VOC family protein n=1 Tax=Microbacterium terrisoli TaxID=3242192 RepID=UPI00280551BC|nr:VOC family protein [Microbacterium protaetiae]
MAHGDVTHLEIPVSDFEASKAFYDTVLGWKINDVPGFDDYPMWQGPNGASGGALVKRATDFTQPRSTVEVDSIDDVLAKAEASGGRVVTPKSPISETSWWGVFEDPDGNVIGLFEGTMG